MKKFYLLIIGLLLVTGLQAQVVKTIENTAGKLDSLLTGEELNTITTITISGTMDARDFKTIRFNLPLLEQIDLSQVTVLAYTEKSETGEMTSFEANVIPEMSFYNKDYLVSVLLPSTITAIKDRVFDSCDKLASIHLPSSVIKLGNSVFFECNSLSTIHLPSSLQFIGAGAFYECYALNDITIPTSVTSIGDYAFYSCNTLTQIEIPSGVTAIGRGTFEGCNALTSVVIPHSVTSIGADAFSRDSSLTAIQLPSLLTEIQPSTFSGCKKLTTLVLPESVSIIGQYAFNGCNLLESINIPSTVSTIGNNAFAGCASLKSVSIPSAITTIDSHVFYGCQSLASLTIPPMVTSIGENAFAGCLSLTSVNIPPLVSSIGRSAFEQCSNITSLVIPSKVEYIGPSAFGGCSKLTSIYSNPSVPVPIESGHFYWLDKSQCTLHVPYGTEASYAAAVEWKDFNIVAESGGFSVNANTIRFDVAGGEFQLTINSTLYWQASSDQPWVTINPDSGNSDGTIKVTAKANDSGAYRFASISLTTQQGEAQSVRVIQKSSPVVISLIAGNLDKILTKEELDTISGLTLTGTINMKDIFTINSMRSLTILDISQTRIVGTQADNVNYPDDWLGGPSVSKNSMNICSGLSRATLKTIKLPVTLKVLACGAFSGCGFTSFTIPPSVTTIGWEAFNVCGYLESITIPATVTFIDQWAFSSCTGLKEVVIEEGIEYIPKGTFAGCSSLISVILPASIRSIELDAFWQSPEIATIYSYNPLPPAAERCFNSVDKTKCIVYVPIGSKSAYENTEGWKEFTHIVEMGEFNLDNTSITLEKDGGQEMIKLHSSLSWRASSNTEWLTVMPQSGTGGQWITLTAQANTDTTRTAIVTIYAEGADSLTITVTQHGMTVGLDEMKSMDAITFHPNPFTEQLFISIANPSLKKVNVGIYTISGQKIKSLLQAQKGAKISCTWNGRNENGQRVPDGMYLLKVNGEMKKVVKR